MKKITLLIACILAAIYCKAQFEENYLKLSSPESQEISTKNLALLLGHNFNAYREQNLPKRVQIKRGPEIILESVETMQANGVTFEKDYLKLVESKANNINTHTTIPVVEIGWNSENAYYSPESEKVVHQNGQNKPVKQVK